jgi:hypothetical protein
MSAKASDSYEARTASGGRRARSSGSVWPMTRGTVSSYTGQSASFTTVNRADSAAWPSTPSARGYGRPNSNRGKSWVSTAIFCGLDQMSVSSLASVAASSEMSAGAEPCIASATIRTSVVVSRTAE